MTARPLDAARDALIALQGQLIAMLAVQNAALAGRAGELEEQLARLERAASRNSGNSSLSVLKYRLYDIDRIISRTLAYAIVTGLLVGVYAGLVLLATQVLTLKSPVAVVGSTLVAAALFSPLRSRVQQAVDRRFNRARYDADQMVAAFSTRLKDAIDRDAVQADLASVVHGHWSPLTSRCG